MNEDKFIKVWRFCDAPKIYQDMSENGGDEDYIAFIPAGLKDEYFSFLECNHFGCCSIDDYPVEGGKIIISAHA